MEGTSTCKMTSQNQIYIKLTKIILIIDQSSVIDQKLAMVHRKTGPSKNYHYSRQMCRETVARGCNKLGVVAKGLSYPLFRCEQDWKGGLRPLIMSYFSLCFFGLTYFHGSGIT